MLEIGGAVHLAGDEYRPVEQQRWLAAFDHVETLAQKGALAEGGPVLVAAGECHSPSGPDQGMDNHWQRPGPAAASQARYAASVIEVPVAEDNDLVRDWGRGVPA